MAAISCEATLPPRVLDGPIDAAAFAAYVEQLLVPALPAGAIIVMDNLGAHRVSVVERLLRVVGIWPAG